ncbi:UNVERIFIED_CONTAM: Ataxin-10 [Sesamum calycinum]|uniref:Ataxin-10 n=1 Tax=Sesamum calycinum TaxID=2727403 RepID=A0AAW2PMG8_9LAMI
MSRFSNLLIHSNIQLPPPEPSSVAAPSLHRSPAAALLSFGSFLGTAIEEEVESDGRNLLAPNFSVPNNVLVPLFIASHSSTLNEALECLIETAKSSDGRLYLASKGEITNQNLFIEQNGVEILSTIISSMALTSGLDNGILRMLLQVLGNVSLASEQHRLVVWRHFFPLGFLDIARVQSNETCDPLCMIIYTCSEGSSERSVDLLSDQGMDIIIEIIRTVTVVAEAENSDDNVSQINHFGAQQAFLLRILSEILNEWIGDIVVPNEFSSCIFQILRNAVGVVDFNTRGKSSLPTGSGDIDVIGYTLSILRDISASGGPKVANQDEKGDAVDTLVSAGLIKFLITLLRDLEPPAIIRKAMIHNEAKDGTTSQLFKYCPYRGFRRDVVAIIGNCSYRKKLVQDEIRELDGILLLLQQCVTDEDNPFLREWGIWSMRNVLEGNTENQQLVANLELQGSVDVPEIAGLGLRVEVDPKTRRPKLVNAS